MNHKQVERSYFMKTIMVYRGGLPDAPSSELFEVDIDKEDLILSQITLGALKNKVIQTYKSH